MSITRSLKIRLRISKAGSEIKVEKKKTVITSTEPPPGQQLRRCFTSAVFLIEIASISISADQDVGHPVRRPAHDIADGSVIGDFRAAFYDQLIMDVTDR